MKYECTCGTVFETSMHADYHRLTNRGHFISAMGRPSPTNVFQETLARLSESDARRLELEFGPRGKVVHIEPVDCEAIVTWQCQQCPFVCGTASEAKLHSYREVGHLVARFNEELPVATATMSSDINPPTTHAEADELRRQLMTLPKGCLQKLYTDLYDGMDMRIDAARREGDAWYKELGK